MQTIPRKQNNKVWCNLGITLLCGWHCTVCNARPRVVKVIGCEKLLTVYLSNYRYKNKHLYFLKRESGLYETQKNELFLISPCENWELVTQSCPILCDPKDCSKAPLSTGFSRQEYWSELPYPPLGDLPHSGVEPKSSCITGRFFTILVTREVQ